MIIKTHSWNTAIIIIFAIVALILITGINILSQAMASTIRLQVPSQSQQLLTKDNGIILRPTNINPNASPHLYLVLTRDENGSTAEIARYLPLIGSYRNGSMSLNSTLEKQIIASERVQISAGDLHHWFFAFSNFQNFPQNITAGLQNLTIDNSNNTGNNKTMIPLEIHLTNLPPRFYELDRSSIPVDQKPHLLYITVKWADSNIDYYMIKVSRSHNYLYLE
jgi:hypothetical protein